jgi:hypothetical protein
VIRDAQEKTRWDQQKIIEALMKSGGSPAVLMAPVGL